MKKVILMAGLIVSMAVVSCKKDPPPAPAPPPPPEAPADIPPPPPPPPAPEKSTDDANGTTVSVGKDGVQVDTKNNTKTTKVEVKNSGTAVEVKKK
ncbi:hypothetical protein [Flavobacterium sp.]|uniref:hypothetical protein n=1 Tax=Flavobacterium sp. TaxID=239 RepID=UPI0026351520|nr:hypothetical protein [Flavobacterium sp.]